MMNERRRSRTAGHRRAAVAWLALLGGLGGCAAPSPSGTGVAPGAQLPPEAIQVGRDLYQVPIGPDADGCQRYRLYSPTLVVTEAISYRSRDGGFTINRRAAVCARGDTDTPAARA
jgi:hypothetical protein